VTDSIQDALYAGAGLVASLVCALGPAAVLLRASATRHTPLTRPVALWCAGLVAATAAMDVWGLLVWREAAAHLPFFDIPTGLPISYDSKTHRVVEFPGWLVWSLHWASLSAILGAVAVGIIRLARRLRRGHAA
jgi:hypothetical protein